MFSLRSFNAENNELLERKLVREVTRNRHREQVAKVQYLLSSCPAKLTLLQVLSTVKSLFSSFCNKVLSRKSKVRPPFLPSSISHTYHHPLLCQVLDDSSDFAFAGPAMEGLPTLQAELQSMDAVDGLDRQDVRSRQISAAAFRNECRWFLQEVRCFLSPRALLL